MLKQRHGRESDRRKRQHTTGPSPHHYERHGNSHHGHRHPKKYSNVNAHSAAQRKSPARKNQQAFGHDSSTSDVSESSAEESHNSSALKPPSAPEDESSDEETPSARKGTLLNFEHRIDSKPPPKKGKRAKKEKKTTKNNASQNDGKGVWENVKIAAKEDARVVENVVEEGVHEVESGIKKVEVYGKKTEKDFSKAMLKAHPTLADLPAPLVQNTSC